MTPTPVTCSLFVFTVMVGVCTEGFSLGQCYGISNFKSKSVILTSQRGFGQKLTIIEPKLMMPDLHDEYGPKQSFNMLIGSIPREKIITGLILGWFLIFLGGV